MNKGEDKCMEAFDMWCYWILTRTSWTENVTNEHVWESVMEKRSLLKII